MRTKRSGVQGRRVHSARYTSDKRRNKFSGKLRKWSEESEGHWVLCPASAG